MAYRVSSFGWQRGGALAGSTPVVILEPGLLAQLNAAYPGWQSASAVGALFTLTGLSPRQQVPGHRIAATITTPGGLGTAQFTYSVDGGVAVGPVATARTFPNGPLNAAFFVYPVPGTSSSLCFTDVNFALNASLNVAPDGTTTSSGMPSANAAYVSTPASAVFPTSITLTLDTLSSTIAGVSVLIQTGAGAGWTSGLVVSDGTSQFAGGLSLPTTARAAVPLGYLQPTGVDATVYAIAGRSGDATHIFYATAGVLAFASLALTTLGAITTGSLAVVETAPTSPQSDAGGWRVLTV